MEWLEQKAISTSPITCRPRLLKRYVDDVLEVIRKGEVDRLTDHLNQTDPSNSIKFTYEHEKDGSIPFLDTLIIRKPDGSVKLCIYRKKTHTDQYLQFSSHYPLHQKLGVIRTLLYRNDSIVTEEEDRKLEKDHIRKALSVCGYPEWTINKVKKDRSRPRPNPVTSKNSTKTGKFKGLAVIPYVEGLSERVARVFRKYGISTAMKPHRTLRSILVHPKDKLLPIKKVRPSMKSHVLIAPNLTSVRLDALSTLASKNIKRKWRNLKSNHTHGPHANLLLLNNINQLLQITLF